MLPVLDLGPMNSGIVCEQWSCEQCRLLRGDGEDASWWVWWMISIGKKRMNGPMTPNDFGRCRIV